MIRMSFCRVWEKVGPTAPQQPSDLAEWEAQYHQVLQAHREEVDGLDQLPEDFDYDNDIMTAWQREHGMGLTSDMEEQPRHMSYDAQGLPDLETYTFGQRDFDITVYGLIKHSRRSECEPCRPRGRPPLEG